MHLPSIVLALALSVAASVASVRYVMPPLGLVEPAGGSTVEQGPPATCSFTLC